MSAIPFIRRTASERVDGTLTVKIDIEPQHKLKFLQMFPEMGSAGAIAALTLTASTQVAQRDASGPTENRAGAISPAVLAGDLARTKRAGPLCVMACTFCADPVFWRWLNVVDEATAKANLLAICNCTSRKQIDGSPYFERIFHGRVRLPFLKWKESQS